MKTLLSVDRVLSLSRTRRGDDGLVLRVAPHVDYLRSFGHVEWEPEVLGLDSVGAAQRSTLVAAPAWALQWLRNIECVKENSWDIPLWGGVSPAAEAAVWKKTADRPAGMRASENFLREGCFINCWSEDGKTHLVCGKINPSDSRSILCFVWLQNVLGGGRAWGRRDMGVLPEDFSARLPMSYTSFGDTDKPLINVSLGLPPPILRLDDGSILCAGEWIAAPKTIEQTPLRQVSVLIFPGGALGTQERWIDTDIPEMISGAFWRLKEDPLPGFLAFYPSRLENQIDRLQSDWQQWLEKNAIELSADRRTELLLCLREATLNADHHGCGSVVGKRILVAVQKMSRQRLLKMHVSDPGLGHLPVGARQIKKNHRSLGLTLIHGLADSVRSNRNGSTIEFDFHF